MDPIDVMKSLQLYGPWAITVLVGIAYTRKDKQINKEREDRDTHNKDLMSQLLSVIESNTVANTKLESAIDKIAETIGGLNNLIISYMHK